MESGKKQIKLHGLQRSGTNYVNALLSNSLHNIDILVNRAGWKHGPYCAPWSLGYEVDVIVVAKNPYSWLVSLYKYWRSTNVGMDLSGVEFDQFVRNRAIFEEQQGAPVLYRAVNPVQHWNNMHFHWLSIRMQRKRTLIVPYELSMTRPSMVVEMVAEELGLPIGTFTPIEGVVEPSQEKAVTSEIRFDPKYYHDKKYMEYFTKDLLDFVNKELDKEVMSILDYQYEEVE